MAKFRWVLLVHAEGNAILTSRASCCQILSRDSVTVSVDAVVYFNVIDAEQALCSVDDFRLDRDGRTGQSKKRHERVHLCPMGQTEESPECLGWLAPFNRYAPINQL